MKFGRSDAEFFVPDGATQEEAMRRAPILAIGAHPDDIEILAIPGILDGIRAGGNKLFGVVATNGGGSLRTGEYANLSYLDMRDIRVREQKQAAVIGRYAGVVLLNYESSEMKDSRNGHPDEDLRAVITGVKPETVYLHNPFDRHDTHVAVCLRSIAAFRAVTAATGWMPKKMYGCEVWRGLDWLVHCDRTALPVHDPDHLADQLIKVYHSQMIHENHYDLAARGRRIANATYQESHSLGSEHEMAFTVDLLPLLEDPAIPVADFVRHTIDRFRADAVSRLERFSPNSPRR